MTAFELGLQGDAPSFVAEFGELITYYPEGVLGAPKLIRAVIDRSQADQAKETGRGLVRRFVLHVLNDATNGLTEWSNSDLAEVPRLHGGGTVRLRVAAQIDQDPGLLSLEAFA